MPSTPIWENRKFIKDGESQETWGKLIHAGHSAGQFLMDVIMNKMGESKLSRRARKILKFGSSIGIGGSCRLLTSALKMITRPHKPTHVSNPEVLLISPPVFATDQPPLGIAYLKAYLAKKGIKARCIDFNMQLYKILKNNKSYPFDSVHNILTDPSSFERFKGELFGRIMDEWVDEILRINPKFLGISMTSPLTYFPIDYIVNSIRSSNPKIKIILGGPCCMIDGAKLIEKGYGDIAIRGEGENAFFCAVEALKKNTSMEGISGLIHISNGKTITNQGVDHVKDLDDLPFPDFDDFSINDYRGNLVFAKLPMAGSRGCVANCDFCNINLLWEKFRRRSAENIFLEMKRNKDKYGVFIFNFNDSLMNANPSDLEELCDLIIGSKEAFLWSGDYRIWEQPAPKKLFEKMVKAGCVLINIGVESGSEKVRKEMGKPFTDKTLREHIIAMHQAGLAARLMFIIGHPAETKEDFEKTLGFVEEYRKYLSMVSFGFTCKINPGTPLWEKRAKYGISYDEEGEWYAGANTMRVRMQRLDYANEIGTKLGIIHKHGIVQTGNARKTIYS